MDDKQDKDTGKIVPEEEQKQDDSVKQVPAFEEQLENAVKQNEEQFYQNVLKEADDRIQSQANQIRQLTEQSIQFRDEVAVRCYVPLINEVSDYGKAAISAYQAADAFLRARENGMIIITKEEAEELTKK
jgi:hypothetical protein